MPSSESIAICFDLLERLRTEPSKLSQVLEPVGGVLSALVMHGADLTIIKAACRLSAHSLSQVNENGWLPLHHACVQPPVSEDVLRFFVQRFPDALTVPDEDGRLPIHLILMGHQWPTLDTIRLMVDARPKTLNVKDENAYTPLDLALMHSNQHRLKYLDYIFSHVSKGVRSFTPHFDIGLTLHAAEALSKLFPQLNKFTCRFSELGTLEGYIHLMECLEANQNIQEVNIWLPTDEILSDAVFLALENMIANNSRIETYSFAHGQDGRPPNGMKHDKNFQALYNAFCRKTNKHVVQRLVIGALSLSDCNGFRKFLGEAAPRRIEVKNLQLAGSWNQSGFNNGCQLEDLTLKFSSAEINAQWCYSALSDLSTMRSLDRLCFDCPDGLDKRTLTEAVRKLLLNGHLRCLHINNAHGLDAAQITKALAKNKRLQIYRICLKNNTEVERHEAWLAKALKSHNTTLKWAFVSGGSICIRSREMINYFTRLNRYGRQEAQDPQTSLADFVKLLACEPKRCMDDLWLGIDVPRGLETETLRPRNKHNVQFGLLRETPALWSPQQLNPSSH